VTRLFFFVECESRDSQPITFVAAAPGRTVERIALVGETRELRTIAAIARAHGWDSILAARRRGPSTVKCVYFSLRARGHARRRSPRAKQFSIMADAAPVLVIVAGLRPSTSKVRGLPLFESRLT